MLITFEKFSLEAQQKVTTVPHQATRLNKDHLWYSYFSQDGDDDDDDDDDDDNERICGDLDEGSEGELDCVRADPVSYCNLLIIEIH